MYSYPNQNFIQIHKQNYSRDFLQIGIDEWQRACRELTPSAFKIYLYLASNKDNYRMALSKQDIKDKLDISFTRFYESIALLRRMHYICCIGNNQFHFFLSPNPNFEKKYGIVDWESPKTENNNLKTEEEVPKTEQISPKTNIEIDNIDKIDNKIDINKPTQNLWSLAEDLDHILFNLASEDNLREIRKWIDVDAYNRVERSLMKVNYGNLENYRHAVLHYLYRLLEKMNDIDVNAIENVIKNILDKEPDDYDDL